MSSLIFQMMLGIPNRPRSRWSCCGFLWQQQNELNSCVDKATHSGTSYRPRCLATEDQVWTSLVLVFSKCQEQDNKQQIKV